MATGTTRPRQRRLLSRELVIETALALLDQDGPGALSMRRLADHLGVAPNASTPTCAARPTWSTG